MSIRMWVPSSQGHRLRISRRQGRKDRIVRRCSARSNEGMDESMYFYVLLVLVFVLAGVVKG